MATFEQNRPVLLKALRLLLRPIAKFCLRSSLSFQDLTDSAKGAFLEAAEDELRKSSGKVNVSRLSVITGLHRKDIVQLLEMPKDNVAEPVSVLGRVIGQWEQDKGYLTQAGAPKVLTFEGKESEFHNLVATVSKAINPSTVLFELVRAGAAIKTPKGLKLLKHSYRVVGVDDLQAYELVAQDINTLVVAVEENLTNKDMISNLHIRTNYDNIYVRDLYKVRRWLIDQGKLFHKKARTFLARCDKDVNPSSDPNEPAGQKVSFTTFSFSPIPAERPKGVKRSSRD